MQEERYGKRGEKKYKSIKISKDENKIKQKQGIGVVVELEIEMKRKLLEII